MSIVNIPEIVCKGKTLGGSPCIVIERKAANSSDHSCEFETLAVFADTEAGHTLADSLIDEINKGKVRL